MARKNKRRGYGRRRRSKTKRQKYITIPRGGIRL